MPEAAAQRVLVVEDEPKLAALLVDYLLREGFAAASIGNGLDAIEAIRRDPPTIVLLDVMLPGADGMAVCREVRRFSALPIIMVTARVDEVDRLLGLELGADDYVCKPFSPREVVARVKAVLRRSPGNPASSRLVVDAARSTISLDGKRLDLTQVEFRLLSTLVASPGRIHTRSGLLQAMYDDYRDVNDRTVDSHVRNLRRKLERVAPGEDIVQSVYGAGYRFEPGDNS